MIWLLAVFVEVGLQFERLGVFLAQLENVPDFDAAQISSVPLPSGEGSPATTLRRSATAPVRAGRGQN
jgi:hypothetical protein